MAKFNPTQVVNAAFTNGRKQAADFIENGGHELSANAANTAAGAPTQVSTNTPKDAAPDSKPVAANPGKTAPVTPATVKSQQENDPKEVGK